MKVLVGMSGGVDSSAAALLLRDAGHEVVGVSLRLWGGESDTGCCSVSDVDDARRVAQQIGIDHVVFNYADEFARAVVGPYVAAHGRGETPNPCIECNRHLKFDALLARGRVLGFDAVATGHHARIETIDGLHRVVRGADTAKDQSYVVHMIPGDALGEVLFPVGAMDKARVRELAAAAGLRTAAKPDSQDVCFITSTGGRTAFLGDRIPFRPGTVVDTDGVRLGAVESVEMVTVGQRKGLGLPGGGPKRYVVDVDSTSATVIVGSDEELLRTSMLVGAVTWVDQPVDGSVLVQCSAHGARRPATIEHEGGGVVSVTWQGPQRRIAPGQSVVFYDITNTGVLGGGICR